MIWVTRVSHRGSILDDWRVGGLCESRDTGLRTEALVPGRIVDALDGGRTERLEAGRMEALEAGRIEALDPGRTEALDGGLIAALDDGRIGPLFEDRTAVLDGGRNEALEEGRRGALVEWDVPLSFIYRLYPFYFYFGLREWDLFAGHLSLL